MVLFLVDLAIVGDGGSERDKFLLVNHKRFLIISPGHGLLNSRNHGKVFLKNMIWELNVGRTLQLHHVCQAQVDHLWL